MRRGATLMLAWAVFASLPGQTPPPPASAPVMIYAGRPLRVPISCRIADFEAAGLFCSDEEPCRLFLELTAVEAVGAKVLVAGNIHTPAATLSSIALASDDAGGSWREPVKRIPGAGFEALQMLDEKLGWIAVQPQTSLASDPYLLATIDGGGTWREHRIWEEEGRTGLLHQFFFTSRTQGFALIDRAASISSRFELYESPNGGASWLLKETSSRPIPPKWSRPPSDWRLREDPKQQTYEVERRMGEAWRAMSSFRTELGVCKSLEEKAPPAPAPPDPPA